MYKTKILDIIRYFSNRERSNFRDYVHSPFFNKNQKLKNLCDIILKFAPDFQHADLDKRKIYTQIFGGNAYNELQINNIISDLLQLAYGFLAQKAFASRPQFEKNLLLEELLNRDANDHIDRIARRFHQLQQQSPFRNHQYFYDEYLLYEKLDRNFLVQPKRRFDENLQLENDNLDLYYLSNKLRIACDMASRNIVIKAGYVCHFIDDLLGYYEKNYNDFQRIPVLNIYYTVLQMLQEEEKEVHYKRLKTALNEGGKLFPKSELWTLYKYALNYCIKKINSGKSQYYYETLDLYKILLEQNIIFHNGLITQWTFKNIITIGIRLEEFEWTEKFIEQYQTYLLPEEKFNAITYNRAALFSATREYKKALQELHNVEFTDSSYHLGAKIIQIKSYYELEETEALFALIETFRKYILRNRDLADYRKKANSNMLKLTKSIYQLKTVGPTMNTSSFNRKRRMIQEKLTTIDPIANKDWLREIFANI